MAGKKRFHLDHKDGFIQRLERYRKSKNWSIEQMSRYLGISGAAYTSWLMRHVDPSEKFRKVIGEKLP